MTTRQNQSRSGYGGSFLALLSEVVTTVAGRKGDVVLAPADVGLPNVDNTSDANKPVSTAQAAADALKVSKTGDTMTGILNLGTGSSQGLVFGGDVNLYRTAADTLKTDDCVFVSANLGGNAFAITAQNLNAAGGGLSMAVASASRTAFGATVTGDANYRYTVLGDGKTSWGPGTAGVDTNLYRSAADTLKTDDSLIVGTNLSVTGTALFKSPTVKVTANYTILLTDSYVLANSATAIVVTLPSAVTAGNGAVFKVKNIAAGMVTMGATAGTIDGAAASSQTLGQWAAKTFLSDGANWFLV